jgi:hypothetical protein
MFFPKKEEEEWMKIEIIFLIDSIYINSRIIIILFFKILIKYLNIIINLLII